MSFEKFRKYQKELLIFFAVVLILPMGIGGSVFMLFTKGKLPHVGLIAGRKISAQEFETLPYNWQRVLNYFPTQGQEQTDQDVWLVHCSLAMAEKWGIEATKDEVDQVVKYILMAHGAKPSAESLTALLKTTRMSPEEFYATIEQFIRFRKIRYSYALGQTVYPTRAQAYEIFHGQSEKAAVDYLKLDINKFKTERPTSEMDKTIAEYYEKHQNDEWLKVPEKVVVEFMGVNYKEYEGVMVEEYYNKNRTAPWMTTTRPAQKPATASAPDKKAKPATAPAERPKTLEEAYDEIVEKLGKENIQAEMRRYIAEAEEELRNLPNSTESMESIRRAYGMIPEKVGPSEPVSQIELYSKLKPLSAMIMPGGRFDYSIKQFADLAFTAELNEISRIENTQGIYLYRVIKKLPAHSPALTEGNTKRKIAAQIELDNAQALALKESQKLQDLWVKDEVKFKKAIEGDKRISFVSKEITADEDLIFAAEAFDAKPAEISQSKDNEALYLWRLKTLIQPSFADFEKDEKRFRQMARQSQMRIADRLWQEEIMKLLEQDNLKVYREARDLAKQSKKE